jgi:hypothetical protein
MVLAEREKLNSAFVPCAVDETSRKALHAKLHCLIANPSPETMDEFVKAANARAEEHGIDTDALTHKSILGQIRKSPADASRVPALTDILRANGIFFGSYDDSPYFFAAFMADILSYATLPGLTRPAGYILRKETIWFFGRTIEPWSPIFFFMPTAWADGQQFIIPCRQEQEQDVVRPAIVQHEAQHVLDQRARIAFQNPEYTSYVAGLAFAPPCLGPVRDYELYPEPQRFALLQIRYELMGAFGVGNDLSRLYNIPDSELNAAARTLLNAAYKTKIGFTYDELVAPFRDGPLA